MGSLSDYLEAKLLDHVLGNTPYTAPSTVYIALYTVAPTDAGGGTEVTGGSYARCAIVNNTTNWPNATGTSPSTKTNGTSFTFNTATAPWGTVVAFAILDSSSSGNFLYWSTLTSSAFVDNGDTCSFINGTIVVTQD